MILSRALFQSVLIVVIALHAPARLRVALERLAALLSPTLKRSKSSFFLFFYFVYSKRSNNKKESETYRALLGGALSVLLSLFDFQAQARGGVAVEGPAALCASALK